MMIMLDIAHASPLQPLSLLIRWNTWN